MGLFPHVFMREQIKAVNRNTLGKCLWVECPGDPREAMRELISYLDMQLLAAGLAFRKANSTSAPTPEAIHGHMLARAKEEPLALFVIIWIRVVDVVLMIDESGKGDVGDCGDYELFATARRLAMPLLCVTHCPDYIDTLTYEQWELALGSDQFRKVIAKHVHCARTATGWPILRDLSVENGVNGFRTFTGKNETRSGANLFAWHANMMPTLLELRRHGAGSACASAATVENVPQDQRTRAWTDVDVKGLSHIVNSRLWELGQRRVTPKQELLPLDGKFRSASGELLDPALLVMMDTGATRHEAFVDGAGYAAEGGLAEEDVISKLKYTSFSPLPITLAERKWFFRLEGLRLRSTDAGELAREYKNPRTGAKVFLFTNAEMAAEINALRRSYKKSKTGDANEKQKKDVLAAALALLRIRKFKKAPPPEPAAIMTIEAAMTSALASELISLPSRDWPDEEAMDVEQPGDGQAGGQAGNVRPGESPSGWPDEFDGFKELIARVRGERGRADEGSDEGSIEGQEEHKGEGVAMDQGDSETEAE